MKLSDEMIAREVERYRKSLVEANREPTTSEIAEEKRRQEHEQRRISGFLEIQTAAGRKILSEGPAAFDANYNASDRKLREVA